MQLSENALLLLEDIRKEIFENLHAYYRNDLALTDYSIRLGNLMSLNHTAQVILFLFFQNPKPYVLQEVSSIFRVFFRFYFSIFDLHMTDLAMTECFLWISHNCANDQRVKMFKYPISMPLILRLNKNNNLVFFPDDEMDSIVDV